MQKRPALKVRNHRNQMTKPIAQHSLLILHHCLIDHCPDISEHVCLNRRPIAIANNLLNDEACERGNGGARLKYKSLLDSGLQAM